MDFFHASTYGNRTQVGNCLPLAIASPHLANRHP